MSGFPYSSRAAVFRSAAPKYIIIRQSDKNIRGGVTRRREQREQPMAGSGFTQLNYCFHCMSRLEPDDPVCPVCGHDNSIRENNSSALPEGTILAGKYLVGRVLGQGGFGITYLGFSTALNMRVAIKEYFPTTIAMRSGNSRRAGEVTSFKDPEGFRKGREEFQAEAMTLARFNSRHIVHVRDYFMENGTGYIVMDYVEGLSLTDLVKESGGSLPWDRVVELFKPLMLELNSLHEEHLIHRDIKPDNIRLTAEKDGSEHLVLLDFGSARSFVSAEITQTYTAMITPGYSPYEQYSRHSRQGPYTDIYSLCATMYALITGTVPPDSAARNIGDVVIRSFEEMGVEVPEQVSRAIMHGLSIRREDRPQTMVELYAEITGKPPVTKAQEPVPAKENIPSEKAVPAESGGTIKQKDLPAAPAPEKKKSSWLLPLLLAVLLAGGFFVWRNLQQNRMNTASTQTAFSLTETANVLQTAAAAVLTQEYAEQLTVQAQAAETSTQDALLAEQTATAWGSTVAAESGQTQTAEAAALAQQTMQVETARVQGTQSAATSTAFSETRIAELHQTQTEAALSTQLVYGEQTAAAQTATQSYEDMLSTRAVWEQQTAEVMEATQQAIIIAQTAMIKTQEAVNTETAGKRTQAAMEITQTEIARAQQELNATQTKMAEPTATFTPSPTATATVTPTAAPTLTATPSPTATETPTDTPVPTATEAPKAALPEAGDVITFGEYEQDNDLNNGAEPIEWQVLAVEDGRALLISKYALDVKPYNETDAEVTWETSTLRKWLNGDFLFTAFSTNEQARIPEIMNLNPDNERFRTFGGNATDDRIFLLISDEAERYFSYSYEARKCSTTAYAEAKGAFISPAEDTVWWWLRTPGIAGNMAAGVDPDGAVFLNGIGVDSTTYLVRPALWLDLTETSAPAATDIPPETAATVINAEKLQAGDELTFGIYEQDNDLNNGAEPIEWLVLAVEDERALLISKYSLDARPYNETKTEVTWETCTLRNWLNGNFFNSAFSSDEKARIFTVINQNPNNPDSDADGGNPTTDQIFLLSIDEAYQYFEDDDIRKCSATAYAKANGAFVPSYWWLRSPGWENNSAASVGPNGYVFAFGDSVDSTDAGIRPALWLDLTVSESSVSFEIPEPTATNTVTPTETPQPTATETPVPTDTPLPTATETPVPTDTPQPTATNTPDPTLEPTEIPTEKQSSGSPYTITLLETEKVESGDYLVTEDVLIRDNPSSSGAVVRAVLTGSKVTSQGKEQNGYMLIKTTEGQEGWISANLLTTEEQINITGSAEISIADLKEDDIFIFGQFEQDNNLENGAEPIEWQVLAIENGQALVISRYGLDAMTYSGNVWEVCNQREWLNSDFLESAFTFEEQDLIAETTLDNPDSTYLQPYYENGLRIPGNYDVREFSNIGGKSTKDRIFLLNNDEADKYFENDESRRCQATDYAISNGAFVSSNGNTMWWLRSGFIVDSSGAIVYSSNGDYTWITVDNTTKKQINTFIEYTNRVVRPAFWLDLTGENESETETVITDTQETQIPAETSDAATETTITQTSIPTDTPQPTAEVFPTSEPTEIPAEEQPAGSPYTLTLLETEKTGSGDFIVNKDVLLKDKSNPYYGSVVRSLLKGTKVYPLEESDNYDYFILVETTEGQEGWIPKNSIAKDEQINIIGSAEVSSADLKADDIFLYGQYEQDNDLTNGAEPIEWQVLTVEDGQALVISRYGLDAMHYNEEDVNVPWETCAIRQWLNGDFFQNAFSSAEQIHITETILSNADNDNSGWGLRIGNDTQDRIFLLSVNEADKYFADDVERQCEATAYAKANGANVYSANSKSWWWTRSPCHIVSYAIGNYDFDGKMLDYAGVPLTSGVVRPAFWLDLSGENESETETVITDTQETQTPAETSDAATETTITQTPVLTETETAEPAATETPVPTAVITPVSLAAGDTLNFGSYEQDNNASNGPEAIEWIVLDTDGDSALLLSKAGLEVKPYHEGSLPAGLTWESCSLRSWLN